MRLHPSSTLPLLPLLTLTSAQAPISQNNPTDASIQASLFAFNVIQGTITGVTPANGTGTSFNINFFDFPASGSPFTYYISAATSIPEGNCSSLTEAFNPYSASSTCKASDPANCAIGALSAKHSSITPTSSDYSFQVFYTDEYLSTKPGAEAYFGGRAIVIADKSGKGVNCGLFPGTAVKETGSGSSSSASASASASASSGMAGATATSSVSASGSSSASASASAATSSAAAAAAGRVAGAGAGVGGGVLVAAAVALMI